MAELCYDDVVINLSQVYFAKEILMSIEIA